MHNDGSAMETEDVEGGEKRKTAAEQATKNTTENSMFLPEGAGQATRDTECYKAETSLKQAATKGRVAAFL